MHNAAATLRALNAGASSGSKSVEALKKDCAQVLSDVEKAENRYREAGNALIDYAYALDAAQAITLHALIAAQNALEAATAARRSAATYDRMALDAHGLQDTEEQTRCARLAGSYRSDAAEYDAQVATQRQIAAQAVADRDAAANRAMERIQQATSQDGLKDSWWDDWGAKITTIIADVAQWVATIAGVLAMLLCWVPVLGQALLAIAAIAGIVAAVANILLAATGERSWTEALISIGFAVLGCVGLGGLKGVLGALRAGAGFVRGGGLASMGARGLASGIRGLGGEGASSLMAVVRNRLSVAQRHVEKTLGDALNPSEFVAKVVKEYGINLRGSGQKIEVSFSEVLNAGNPGRVYEVAPQIIHIANLSHFASSDELALTIAHELNHCRAYLKGLTGPAVTEDAAYAAENALRDWINGLR